MTPAYTTTVTHSPARIPARRLWLFVVVSSLLLAQLLFLHHVAEHAAGHDDGVCEFCITGSGADIAPKTLAVPQRFAGVRIAFVASAAKPVSTHWFTGFCSRAPPVSANA